MSLQSITARLNEPGRLVGYGHAGIGAVLTADTPCTKCGRRFTTGHVVTADLLPNMAGTWHHTDCDDPKLERDF